MKVLPPYLPLSLPPSVCCPFPPPSSSLISSPSLPPPSLQAHLLREVCTFSLALDLEDRTKFFLKLGDFGFMSAVEGMLVKGALHDSSVTEHRFYAAWCVDIAVV